MHLPLESQVGVEILRPSDTIQEWPIHREEIICFTFWIVVIEVDKSKIVMAWMDGWMNEAQARAMMIQVHEHGRPLSITYFANIQYGSDF
jgi:hypothetical protein